jgi:glycine/D-amino acid oxidase-like deaminating enzyme
VVVIGGGAMGSAAAWALTRAGREVLLLERFGPGHDRGGSHGSTRIFRLMYAEGDYVRLAQRALRAWRDLESESGTSLLTTTGGIDHGLDEPALAVRAAVLSAHSVPFEVLDPAAASERWPGMAFDGPVVHQPDGRVAGARRHPADATQAGAGAPRRDRPSPPQPHPRRLRRSGPSRRGGGRPRGGRPRPSRTAGLPARTTAARSCSGRPGSAGNGRGTGTRPTALRRWAGRRAA